MKAVWTMSEEGYKKLVRGVKDNVWIDDGFIGRVVIGTMCADFYAQDYGTETVVLTTENLPDEDTSLVDRFENGDPYYEVCIEEDDINEIIKRTAKFGFESFKAEFEHWMNERFCDECRKPSTESLWNKSSSGEIKKYVVEATVKFVVEDRNVVDAISSAEYYMKHYCGCSECNVLKVERKISVEGESKYGKKCWYMQVKDAARKIATSIADESAKKYSFADANEESNKVDVECFDPEYPIFGVAFSVDVGCFDGMCTTIGVSSWGGRSMDISCDKGDALNEEHINRIAELICNEVDVEIDDTIYLVKEE